MNQDLRIILRETKENLNLNLENLKTMNVKVLKDFEKDFNLKMKSIENSKTKLSMEYEAIMKGNINKLLKELTIKMYSQTTNYPKELKPCLNYGDYLTIMTMKNQLSKNIEKEYLILKPELGKNDKTLEWFEKKYNEIC